MTAAATIIRDSIVWESAVGWTPECLDEGPAMLDRFAASGFTFLSLTIAADWDRTEPALRHFARERRRFEAAPDRFRLAETTADIRLAKAEGRLAIGFHCQGAGPMAWDPAMVAPFYRLGIRWAILAYNTRNPLGDGCHEPENAGLSMQGRAFLREMNRVGMIPDASHAGERTALDILTLSDRPAIVSHSNARAVCDHERNVSDAVIRAVGANGGVIGVNAIGAFVNPDKTSGVAGLVRHIDHIAGLVGPAHVGLGLDVVFYQDFMAKLYAQGPMMRDRGYPPPPWDDVKPEALPDLVSALLGRGYAEAEIRGILGENFMRVAEANWT